MFLNYIKNFFTQKTVKKSLSNVKHSDTEAKIKTVGIIFDESYFYEKDALVQELISNGIYESQISILVFKNKIPKNESFDYPVFSHKDLSWAATFDKSEVKDFIAKKFDLLINYYDTEKAALLLVTNQSKAKFKVGFSSIDKKLNHFMINTNAENYKVFVDELFKYLKILNKI
ncbi:hypothetical protein FNO01nite_15290 [Flavobacterium noncentrifugens]|uniref:Uncharacterized protein n=1 Tax=Flavobacterium noncentrifugens TaxID=1128970 RepID=A0A1G8WDJ8_9FLAO|nr:hypothetical protein [Flavobacterium noncentrifugens]GEP50857.1 hypothetical protein FNO01nite_15290 [Flavobacterium noncentrifugens]SDJ75775.1 hypothetical protein SAMN04487935_1745 [Flavobacterium noncentrifugens]